MEALCRQRETRYAVSGDVSIAYQVVGDGPLDLVHVAGWSRTSSCCGRSRLRRASTSGWRRSAALILFDKRGTGLSDRVAGDRRPRDADGRRARGDGRGRHRARGALRALRGRPDERPLRGDVPGADARRSSSTARAPRRRGARTTRGADPRGAARMRLADVDRADWGDAASWTRAGLGAERRRRPAVHAIGAANATEREPRRGAARSRRMNTRDRRPRRACRRSACRRSSCTATDDRLVASSGPLDRRAHPGRAVRRAARARPLRGSATEDASLDEIEEFLDRRSGREARSPIACSPPSSSPTSSARREARRELGDRRWRELLERHHALVRRELARFRGREIDTAGDGFFATFDGPARAIRCAAAIAEAVRDARARGPRRAAHGRVRARRRQGRRASPSTSARASPRRPARARCSSRRRSRTWSPARASRSRTAASPS